MRDVDRVEGAAEDAEALHRASVRGRPCERRVTDVSARGAGP
jgi:hypothetical protein